MRHIIVAASLWTGLLTTFAFAQSRVVYTLEIGGYNHAAAWENNETPTFTSGVTSAPWPQVTDGGSITWAVRVSVGGRHIGPIGDGLCPLGAANLAFDLELYDSDGNLVPIGAAPLVAKGNENVPAGPGFWSSINDGDTAGARGAISVDPEANAAFAVSIGNTDSPQRYRLIDPAPLGPGFDMGWYPAANGRGGLDIHDTASPDHGFSDPAYAGKLVGFTAGMAGYDYSAYRLGVGKRYLSDTVREVGFGAYVDDLDPAAADPLLPPPGVQERALFEGQISVKQLCSSVSGWYTLKVRPRAESTQVVHGAVAWDSLTPDYGGYDMFAVPANEVYPVPEDNPGVKFFVQPYCPRPQIVGRHAFYNQSNFDGNRAGIDPGPIAGARNDDADAIDPTKSPLMLGGGQSTFTNWTGYNKGINGLIYDFAWTTGTPRVSDFSFHIIGRNGGSLPVEVQPSGFVTYVTQSGGYTVTRCVFSFDSGAIKRTWLQVTIGTGLGLPSSETHFWGNAPGDTGDNGPYTPNRAITVSSTDFDGIRTHPTAPNGAAIDNRYDIDKNARVSSTDTDCVIGNPTNPGNALKAIVK